MNVNTINEAKGFIHALEREIVKSPLHTDRIEKKNNLVKEFNKDRLDMLNHQLALYRTGKGRLQA